VLVTGDAQLSTTSTLPMNYGSSSTNTYKPPELIRADPAVTKDIHELLAYFYRQSKNEAKAEKVRVHEIYLDEESEE
jgi:hypothetical protein